MTSLQNIQWFSLDELAELWAPELKLPKSLVLRELQYAMYKLEDIYDGAKLRALRTPLKEAPPDEDLPSKDTRVNREFVESFSEKEDWIPPSFWTGGLPKVRSFPGRPSIMNAILQELECLAKARKLKDTLAEQSRELEAWARKAHPGAQRPATKSIENGIRHAFKMYKLIAVF